MLSLNRITRAALAILFSLGILVALMVQRDSIQDAEKRLSLALISSAWKTSELIFEGQRLSVSIKSYIYGEVPFPEVRKRFDIFWSRVSVVRGLDLEGRPHLNKSFDALRTFLDAQDPVFFATKDPEISVLRAANAELEKLITQTRVTWINEYNRTELKQISPASMEISKLRNTWEIGSSVLLAVILIYLTVELLFASKAQRRERELTQAAQAASETKSAFIANVSHEIRTPLNGVLGMARVLGESDLDSTQREHLGVLEEAGELLLSTINEVLDFSKIEVGEIPIEYYPFDAVLLLEKVRALFEPTAAAKGLELRVVPPQGVVPVLMGDARRIQQVLHNLVSNALKFTETGSVVLKLRYVPRGRIAGQSGREDLFGLFVSVTDTGIGIAPSAQGSIFDPFGQADESTTRTYGGTGLGLSISRSTCEAMGGTLQVKSVVEHGAQFDIHLPLDEADEIAPDADDPKAVVADVARFAGLRVAIVDDNKTNRLILRRFLSGLPISISTFENGYDVLEHLAGHDADLIFMDVQMPGIDGPQTTRDILAMAKYRDQAPPKVVAVTANALPSQEQIYRAAGMELVLNKPISKSKILRQVAEVAAQRANREDAAVKRTGSEAA